jgi:hypothetical protein
MPLIFMLDEEDCQKAGLFLVFLRLLLVSTSVVRRKLAAVNQTSFGNELRKAAQPGKISRIKKWNGG